LNKDKRIVIIGGTACGPKAAARARRCDPHAGITIIEQDSGVSTATCGFPYYVSGVIPSNNNLRVRGPDYFKSVLDVDLLLHTRAEKIVRNAHSIVTIDLKTGKNMDIEYDKLVIATGSSPVIPDIEGKNLQGIFTLSKIEDAEMIKGYIARNKIAKTVIIGAGFIGLEMAEAFSTLGTNVTIIEALDRVMPQFFDFEMSAILEKHLRDKGINVYCGHRVTGFRGDGDGMVSMVITDKMTVETQLVLLATGTRPNVQLARDAKLNIGSSGGIAVNEYLQTSDPDIYAGGDCVQNLHRITGQQVLVPLGSTANKHGRIIGTNITGGSDTFPGVLGTGIAKVFDFNAGRVGLTEMQAKQSGYKEITCLTGGMEHAGYYPGSRDFVVKLVVDGKNNRVLGGQLIGAGDVAKRVDVLVTAITFGATVQDMSDLDLAYAPPYNGAFDPIHHASNTIRNKQDNLARGVPPAEVKAKLDNNDDFILLDVRSPLEWQAFHIDAPQSQLIPLDKLREKILEISRDKEIIILCHTSVRAYIAQRILDGAGYENVKFMDGSLISWPYPTKKN
jgi:NADPH-dependent 2,4-dienoyl-CoA reductase/sulfur reductase-like enzyme/rhodanese-related sulfurtransferase